MRNAPCMARNFVRSVGTSEWRWRSTRSGCVAAAASRSVNTTPLLASTGSRCVSMASELCWISRPERSPIAPAAASTSPGTSSRFAARPPGVYGAKSSANPERSVYRHSSVSCEGTGIASNSRSARSRISPVKPAASGSSARACSSKRGRAGEEIEVRWVTVESLSDGSDSPTPDSPGRRGVPRWAKGPSRRRRRSCPARNRFERAPARSSATRHRSPRSPSAVRQEAPR